MILLRMGYPSTVVLAISLLMVGCGSDGDQPKYITVSGLITSVDEETSEVSIETAEFEEEPNQIFLGRLAPDAEILIDGRTAGLSELVVSDNVTAVVRVEKRGGETHRFATRVFVNRESVTPYITDTRPATAPLDGD